MVLVPHPLDWKHALPHLDHYAKFDRCWSDNYLPKKLGILQSAFQGHPRSSELTQTNEVPHLLRGMTSYYYDFLLTFYSKHGPILYCHQDIAK